MDDALGVRRGEYVEQLVDEGRGLFDRQPVTRALPELAKRLPLEELHDEEHRAVFCGVVVQDAYRSRMVHCVRDVPLPEEARSERLARRDCRMEHLDCDAMTVAVYALVDGRHAPDANQGIERVLSTQSPSDPLPRVCSVVVHCACPGAKSPGYLRVSRCLRRVKPWRVPTGRERPRARLPPGRRRSRGARRRGPRLRVGTRFSFSAQWAFASSDRASDSRRATREPIPRTLRTRPQTEVRALADTSYASHATSNRGAHPCRLDAATQSRFVHRNGHGDVRTRMPGGAGLVRAGCRSRQMRGKGRVR